MQYKGSKKGLSEIARELNIDAVLEGTVERAGDQVRVIVRLDQVSPEGQLWSNQYNRDIRDLLRLQDEIARAVTDEIQVKLKPQEHARLASSRPVDPEAQDDYFRALHFRNKWEESYTSEQDNLTNAIIDALFGIEENVIGPNSLLDLFPSNQFAWVFQQKNQDLKRLFL
jgi:hypothetical protein